VLLQQRRAAQLDSMRMRVDVEHPANLGLAAEQQTLEEKPRRFPEDIFWASAHSAARLASGDTKQKDNASRQGTPPRRM